MYLKHRITKYAKPCGSAMQRAPMGPRPSCGGGLCSQLDAVAAEGAHIPPFKDSPTSTMRLFHQKKGQ